MKPLRVFESISVDGYFTDSDGSADWAHVGQDDPEFAEWVAGRNPATYVAGHYLKLIDFSFGPDWRLTRVSATGQRGLVGPAAGPTWDSVQLQVVYTHPDDREAAFDVHTSWVTPDNFPGYV